MLKDMVVEVTQRQNSGKNESRRLRVSGQIPGVVYGGGKPVVAVAVEQRRILEILRSESGENTLFTLQLGGSDAKRVVMIREYQRDPVLGRLLHVDFVRVDLTKTIEVKVPVHIVGVPIGVKLEGGLADHVVREVSVACLPADIPGSLEIDASEVHVGQHLSVRDIKVSDKIRILDDPDQTVLVVALPKAEAVEAPAAEGVPAEAAPSEPELIKKGKESAEDETAGDAKKGGEPGKKGAEPAKKSADSKKPKEGGKG